jgi:hypothetical protein
MNQNECFEIGNKIEFWWNGAIEWGIVTVIDHENGQYIINLLSINRFIIVQHEHIVV